jgi:hypothetical protein
LPARLASSGSLVSATATHTQIHQACLARRPQVIPTNRCEACYSISTPSQSSTRGGWPHQLRSHPTSIPAQLQACLERKRCDGSRATGGPTDLTQHMHKGRAYTPPPTNTGNRSIGAHKPPTQPWHAMQIMTGPSGERLLADRGCAQCRKRTCPSHPARRQAQGALPQVSTDDPTQQTTLPHPRHAIAEASTEDW